MGNRLTTIVTKGGDAGLTSLGSGTRVAKDHPYIETLGAIDELNSWIGVFGAFATSDDVRNDLEQVQHDLFDLGAQVCVPGTPRLSAAHVARIEAAFGRLNEKLDPLKEFILPGGSVPAAYGHVARTVCRRVERGLVNLAAQHDLVSDLPIIQSGPDYGIAYLNRLSDYLFVAARTQNAAEGRADVLWQRSSSKAGQ